MNAFIGVGEFATILFDTARRTFMDAPLAAAPATDPQDTEQPQDSGLRPAAAHELLGCTVSGQ